MRLSQELDFKLETEIGSWKATFLFVPNATSPQPLCHVTLTKIPEDNYAKTSKASTRQNKVYTLTLHRWSLRSAVLGVG